MLSSAHPTVNGMTGTSSDDFATPFARPAGRAEAAEGGDLLNQLVSVYQSNEYLFSELKSVKKRLTQAQTYLKSPNPNTALALAHLNQLKARHSAVLTMLRANRLQARALLSDTAAEADVA